MADEPNKEHPDDIESILSDLDSILTDMGGDAKDAPKIEPVSKPVEPPKPVEPAKPVEIPNAELPVPLKAEAPPPPPPPPPAPKPTVVPIDPAKASQPIIELAPREGMIKPAAKPPEPPKPEPAPIEAPKVPAPIAPPKATLPPPSSTVVPAPAPVVASTKIEELAADTPKEQIRRVAYVYTAACAEVKVVCAAFLSQSARTISKKPLFLREVLAHEVTAASVPNVVLQNALQVKACAVLALVEGWTPAKVDELSEACSRANLLFRAVAPADALKKSTAVDIIVDMMLLPGEG